MSAASDSVRIVLFNQAKDSFLVLSETDDPENFKLAGGKFNDNELPDQAAARELDEELGVSPETVQLQFAGKLLNDDGTSKRFIYTGVIEPTAVKPSNEVHAIGSYREATVPAGKNKGHILSAVNLARTVA